MADEKPTGDAGASISERIEAIIARDDGQQPQQTEQTGQAAPEPGVEGQASDAQDEPEGPQFELPDVAKILELEETDLDVDEAGGLKIKIKIDGQESTAKLKDLVKSYQLQGHVDAKVRQVAEKEKAVAERVQQYEQFAQAKFQELEGLAQAAHQTLMAEYGAVDWEREYENDPLAFPKKQFEFQKRQGQVSNLLQAIRQQQQQVQQALAYKTQQEIQGEVHRLTTELVKEWADPKVREAEFNELRQWAVGKGASEQSVWALRDAGLLNALRVGMLAERNKPAVAATEKKVRTAPKLVRPGAGTTANERASETVRGLKETIRKSGGKQGIQEYLMATGKV